MRVGGGGGPGGRRSSRTWKGAMAPPCGRGVATSARTRTACSGETTTIDDRTPGRGAIIPACAELTLDRRGMPWERRSLRPTGSERPSQPWSGCGACSEPLPAPRPSAGGLRPPEAAPLLRTPPTAACRSSAGTVRLRLRGARRNRPGRMAGVPKSGRRRLRCGQRGSACAFRLAGRRGAAARSPGMRVGPGREIPAGAHTRTSARAAMRRPRRCPRSTGRARRR